MDTGEEQPLAPVQRTEERVLPGDVEVLIAGKGGQPFERCLAFGIYRCEPFKRPAYVARWDDAVADRGRMTAFERGGEHARVH